MRYLFTLVALAIAAPASAELIFFSEHRSMSVASHRFEGDRVIVALRGGGEMSFDRALITKIAPDEVPYHEDAAVESPAPVPPLAVGAQLAGKTTYDPLIERAATRHDVDARIVKAVIQVESAFQPRARSSKGAMGLMQLMPRTAQDTGRATPTTPPATSRRARNTSSGSSTSSSFRWRWLPTTPVKARYAVSAAFRHTPRRRRT